MKYKLFIIILILTISDGCNVLDTKPYSSILAEDVFTNKKGLDAAMTGAYAILFSASFSQDAVLFADLAADNLIHIGTKKEYRQISDNIIVPENLYVEALWANSYVGINRVNNIMINIDNVSDITEDEKDIYLAQCRFLRAYFYFTLVKYFGGVPIREIPVQSATPEELNIPRETEETVYDFILDDLLKAEALMNGYGKANPSFVNEGAIKAFLARVYLYRQDWANAEAKAQEVIDMDYILEMNDFSLIFDESSANKEIIFQIDFNYHMESYNGIADWVLPTGRFEVAAWDNAEKTASIVDEFEIEDVRNTTVSSTGADYYCNKYQDLLTDKDNIIIFRLAEMYLIRSEALNEIDYVADGDAFSMLNAIRTRAGLEEMTSTELTNKEVFRLEIEQQRRLEFAFEGHRLFDLKRTGRINTILPDIGTLKSANWLFPIPQSELDTNEDPGMIQNTGY